jgi:putative pyruvate formate lyase activating enzyme
LEALRECRLCPRECGVDRLAGDLGFCGASGNMRVAAVSVHYGEEPPISATGGSGTVFFSHCNMACLFCQNYPISQYGNGKEMTSRELAEKLLGLQDKGVHNVNFVTPTPHVPRLIEAVGWARGKGLAVPVVYNTNGYESLDALALLEGVVDIYLPDMKYRSAVLAERASGTPDYVIHNERAIAEMVRQVGPLILGKDGIAKRGVLIRHLVLPGRVDETVRVLRYLRGAYGRACRLSLMGQYFPAHKAPAIPGYDRKLSKGEYEAAVREAERLGMDNVYIQEIEI